MSETIERYLSRMLIKDQVKPGNRWKSTNEIAATTGASFTETARKLADLHSDGLINKDRDDDEFLWSSSMTLFEAKQLHSNYTP